VVPVAKESVVAEAKCKSMNFHEAIGIVLGMLIVAMTVALLVRRWRLPYTVVLVIAGLIIALSRRVPGLTLSPEDYKAVCYDLLLPALLFEAALNFKWEFFVRNWRPIFTLALPGTLVSIGLVGLLVHHLLGVPLLQSLLLGAIISPTDPLSVLAIFRQLGVSRRLSVLIEGESLFNDAVGLVIFTILLKASGPGGGVNILDGVATFFFVSVGGAIVGGVFGLVASRLTRHVDDHLIEVTLSTVLAYGAFLAAEAVNIGGQHFSGIIAVVVAGLCMGNYGEETGMSATTVVALHNFWEYAGFVVNSIVFLLIGTELAQVSGVPDWPTMIGYALLVYLIMTAARAVVAYGGGHVISKLMQPLPLRWRHVLVWGGLKGALSMVMVLSVPTAARQWQGFDFLITATFGVVFISLVLQGLTIRRLSEFLGLDARPGAVEDYEMLVGQIIAHQAALNELERLNTSHVITHRVFASLREPRETQIARLAEQIEEVQEQAEELEQLQVFEAQRLVHHAEKSALLDAFRRGLIAEKTLQTLAADIDKRHIELEAERDKLSRTSGDSGVSDV